MRHSMQIVQGFAVMLLLAGCGEAVINKLFNPQSTATAHVWYETNHCVDSPYRIHAFDETLYTQASYDDDDYSNLVDKTTQTITDWNINGFVASQIKNGIPVEYICAITANQEPFKGDPDSITLQCIATEENPDADAFLSTMWKTKELATAHPYTTCM